MKRIRCPKCDTGILFDDALYQPGRTLVFECPDCKKQFKIKVNAPKEKEEAEQPILGTLTVVENLFHYTQKIELRMGKNVIGRHVRGTAINAPITTTDPSVDTRHCMVEVKKTAKGKVLFVLSDCQSNTGTFLMTELLGVNEQVYLNDKDIITIGATTLIFEINHEELDK